MSWIKVRTELHESPSVIRIVSRICRATSATGSARTATTCHILGALVRLWGIADTHSTDGCLPGYTAEVIDEMVGLSGFCDALIAEGWLLSDAQGVVIPEFTKHNGESAKARADNTRRQSSCRAKRATDVALNARPEKRREEKRREEEKNTPLPPKWEGECGNGNGDALETSPPCAQDVDTLAAPRSQTFDEDIGGIGLTLAHRIYAAYPRKAKREASIAAIARAANKLRARGHPNPPAFLQERVEAFSRSDMGKPGNKFCPLCDAWMDAGRYDDDESEWSPREPDPAEARRKRDRAGENLKLPL